MFTKKRAERTSSNVWNVEYESFRASVPQRKVMVDSSERQWTMYESGPTSVKCPLVLLPPVSGGADTYFKQMLALTSLGYRLISVDYPPYWSLRAFCEGFQKFLDMLDIQRVHLFGSSLGGYLAQKYAEHTYGTPRVVSLVLCNTFSDTSIFDRDIAAYMFWLAPGLLIKRYILSGFPRAPVDPEIARSLDFMVESLENMDQETLASRMTLNCAKSSCSTAKLAHLPIALIDVFDECALTHRDRDVLHRLYPHGRRAGLKTGGNFPFLSRCAEVNMHIQLHLKQFEGTQLSAKRAADAELVIDDAL